MTKHNKKTIKIYHETAKEGIITSTVSFLFLFATVALGVYLQSTALQWTGVVLFWIFILSRFSALQRKMTIDEAIDELNKRKQGRTLVVINDGKE